MSKAYFDTMYQCTFELAQRELDIDAKLCEYYDNTPDSMSNKGARVHWDNFMHWCTTMGYSKQEVTSAKCRCAFKYD